MDIQAREKKGTLARASESLKLDVLGQTSIAVQVADTFTGTLVFEGTVDGTTWNAISLINVSTRAIVTQTTAVGLFIGSVAGLKEFRARTSALSSGEIDVSLITSLGNVSSDRLDNTVSSANTPSIATGATALAANSARKGWMIQNVGTNPLFVRLGADASATVFHAVLKAGTGDNDGLGASISQMNGVIYTGLITIAGTSPKYVVTEL